MTFHCAGCVVGNDFEKIFRFYVLFQISNRSKLKIAVSGMRMKIGQHVGKFKPGPFNEPESTSCVIVTLSCAIHLHLIPIGQFVLNLKNKSSRIHLVSFSVDSRVTETRDLRWHMPIKNDQNLSKIGFELKISESYQNKIL